MNSGSERPSSSGFRVLLATDSPAIHRFVASLQVAAASFHITRVPLGAEGLHGRQEPLAGATVAIVGAVVDRPAAVRFCQDLQTRRPELPILALVSGPEAITLWHLCALAKGKLNGMMDLQATHEELSWALGCIERRETVMRVRLPSGIGALLRNFVTEDAQLDFPINSLAFQDPSTTTSREEILTARECEVLDLLAGGATDKNVAAQLGVSLSTVQSHVHSIVRKLQVRTRFQLGIVAAKAGLIESGDSADPSLKSS
jgi:DNA-binding NarL/FixJ family response regulator